MNSSLPPIHVMPFIGAHALYKIATLDPAPGEPFGTSKKGRDVYHSLAFGPIDEVFADVAPAEAMFVCYRRRNNGPVPRVTKACEGKIDLVADYIAYDIDLNAQFGEKGKLSWKALGEERTAIMRARVKLAIEKLREHDAEPLCDYTSKNGLRFVHLFHLPLTVAGLELALVRIAKVYDEAGIKVDKACFDWTRCFKVPRCTLEDGTVTDTQSWFQINWRRDAVTLATPEELAAQPQVGHSGDVSTEARMEVSHAREAIERDGKLTEDGLAANHALRSDPELHSIVFGSGSIVPERGQGKTHTTLTKLVGRASKRLVGYPWATEQFIYALFAPKVAELGDDEPWLDKVWGMVCDYLASDRAELASKNAEVKAEMEEKATVPPSDLQVFCDGIRAWFPDAVGQDDEAVVELVKAARLPIATSQDKPVAYLLQKNGFYSAFPIAPEKMALRIREAEMEWLISPTASVPVKKGSSELREVQRSWPDFLANDARTFTSTRMLCVHRGNYLSKDECDNTQFVISPFWLRDLEPKFNEQVETWLHLAAPDGEGRNLIQALAYLLAFKFGPTAAVALIGPRSVGKKLIATGLAECINTQQLCPGIVLVSRFNGGLTKSPIVWIDEGIPKGGDGIDFADTFRNLVTGGKLPIEEKGKERTDVAGVHRVVITANNYKTIAQLGEDQVRDGDDLDAIGERLVVFRLQQRAADYLASIDTTGWIAGDNGAPSQFVIARHLLWHLYNTVEWIDGKPRRLGRRLLYEGRRDVVRAVLDTNSAKDAVCAAVLNAITRGHETVRFFQGRLWIEPVAFMSALGGARQLAFAERERLEQAMRALAPKIDKSREFRGTSKDGQAFPLKCARWFLWQDIERLEESVGPLPTEAKTLLDAGNVEAGR